MLSCDGREAKNNDKKQKRIVIKITTRIYERLRKVKDPATRIALWPVLTDLELNQSIHNINSKSSKAINEIKSFMTLMRISGSGRGILTLTVPDHKYP